MGTDGASVPVGPPPGAKALRTLQDVGPIDPDTHALALRSVDKLQISEALARSIVRGDPRALYPVDEEHAAIFAQDKELREWTENPNNAAIGKDDIPRLAALGRALESHKPAGFFGGMADASESGGIGLVNDMVALSAAKGATDPETAERLILAGLAKQEELAQRAPEGLREFDKATGFGGKIAALPAALPYLGARALPSLGAVMGAGAVGGATGAAVASPIAGGIEAAAPFTGPAAPFVAIAGGVVEAGGAAFGATAGTFSAFGLMGAGGTALQQLLARPDARKPGTIAAALRDPVFLAQLNRDANISGVTNAAVTSVLMHLLPAGQLTGEAKGVVGKAGALAKETGIQTGVQLAGPLAAEVAVTGKIDTENLPGQVVESAAMGVGFILHGALKTAEARRDFAKATQAAQDAHAFEATTDRLAESKVPARFRPAAEEYLQAKNRAVGLDVVGIPREAWDKAQIDAGRSPRDEAARLVGGDHAVYDEATRSGEIKVPAHVLQYELAKDKPLRDVLLPDLRLRPHGDTLAEGVARIQTMIEAQERAEVTPEEQEAQQVRQAEQDEQRSGELTAALGVPEDTGVLHQGPAPDRQADEPTLPPRQAGQPEVAAPASAAAPPDGEVTFGPQPEVTFGPQQEAAPEAKPKEASPLIAAADAIEGAQQRPAARAEAAAAGAQPIAEAARAALTGLPPEQVEPIAQAAQRDPAGTAARLRELSAVRERQAKVQPEEVARRKAIESAIRSSSPPKARAAAAPAARVLSDFIGQFKRRFPSMAEKLDALMVRFAKEGAPGVAAEPLPVVVKAPPKVAPPPKPAPAAPGAAPEGRRVGSYDKPIGPMPQGKGQPIPRVDGRETRIHTAGATYEARLSVVELRDLKPSHRIEQSPQGGRTFSAREGYPEGLQPRDYTGDVAEQEGVERLAAELPEKAALYLGDGPTVTDGPPAVATTGEVLNGNRRAMSLELRAIDKGVEGLAEYRAMLLEQAERLGLDKDAIEAMDEPVLVRVVDIDPFSEEAKVFAREGNVALTGGQGAAKRMAALSALLPDDAFALEVPKDSTLAEVLSGDSKAARVVLRKLYDAMPANLRPEFFTEPDILSPTGKVAIGQLLLSKVLDQATVEGQRDSIKAMLLKAVPQIATMERLLPAELQLRVHLEEALRFGRDALLDWTLAPGQGSVFEPSPFDALPPVTQTLVRYISEHARRDTALQNLLRDYVTFGEGSTVMGKAHVTPEEALAAAMPKAKDATLKQDERGSYDPTERLITMFKGADPSTALHESAHWIGDVITRLAADPEAPPELRAFRDQMFTAAEADPMQAALTVEQHETLAKGLEAFVFGGAKAAPSVGLRKTFATLQALLLTVYKSVRQIIGVDALSPALRDFYGRLLATDAEIAAAQKERGPAPILTADEAARAGVPDDVAAAMQTAATGAQDSAVADMSRKVLADLDKQERARRNAKIAELQEQERARLNETGAFHAVANMRDGTLPDGSPLPEGHEQVKLDRDATVAAGFNEKTIARLDKMGVFGKDGAHPADAAELFGFDNATDLLEAMMGSANFDKVSRDAAMQRMAVEHPELVHDPIRRRIEARKSLDAGDARAKLVEAEIKAMEAAASAASATAKAKKGLTEAEVTAYEKGREAGSAPVKGLQREASAAKDALSAEKIGQQQEEAGRRAAFAGIPTRGEARDYARRTLARRELRDIKPEVYRAGIARERSAAAEKARQGKFEHAARHLGQELTMIELYREALAIHKQAASDVAYNLKIQSPSAQKVLNRVDDGSAEQANAVLDRFQFRPRSGPQIERSRSLAEWLEDKANAGYALAVPADLVNEARRQHWSTLKPGELHAIRELLEGIYTLARDKDRFRKEQRVQSIKEAGDEAVESVRTHAKPRAAGPAGALTPAEKAKRDVADLLSGGQVAPMTARIMDGEVDGGPMDVHTIRPINEATDAHSVAWREALEADADNYRRHFTAEEMAALDERHDFAGAKLSHNDRLSVLGHMGSVEGLQRLAIKFSPEQLDAIRKSFTPADYAFAAEQWAHFKAKFEEAAAQHKRITGQVAKPLELSPVQFVGADGKLVELEGGYHPAAYRDLARFRYRSADWARQTKGGTPASQMLEMGFLQPRIENPVTGDLRLDHDVVRSHLHAITHTIAFREAVLDVEAFLGHQGLRDAITETHGLQTLVMFDNWLKRVAGGARGARSGLEKGAAYLRHGAVSARLAFRAVSALHNLYGLRLIVVRNGWGAFGSAMKAWFADSESVYKMPEWIRSKSSAYAERQHGTWLRELEESRQSLPGKLRTFATHYGFLMMSKTQQFNDTLAWLSGYHKAMGERPAGMDVEVWEREAVARADQSMRDTQSSGQAVDLSEWTGGGPLARMLTTFGTDMSLKFNHTRLAASRVRGPADLARFACDAAMLYFFEAAAFTVAGQVLGTEDDKPIETGLRRAAGEMADAVPFVRELSGPIRGFNYRGPAGLMTIGAAVDAGIQVHQGELDPALWRSLNLLGGSVLDYPAAAINEFGDAIGQVYGGEIPTALVGVRPKK